MSDEKNNKSRKQNILIVEDDAVLARGLARALADKDRDVAICASLRETRAALRDSTPDLLLLDVNLPDGNGFDFLANLRKSSEIPVIFLTANDMETDIVAGLEMGADDYITKPFSLAVLRARVNTQLRKKKESPQDNPREIRTGRYRFDFSRMEFRVDGEKVELSRTEQKLLRVLVENEGITITREQLMDRIWTDGADFVDENALSVAVKRLRDKLGAQDVIRTVYGIGYVWKQEKAGTKDDE